MWLKLYGLATEFIWSYSFKLYFQSHPPVIVLGCTHKIGETLGISYICILSWSVCVCACDSVSVTWWRDVRLVNTLHPLSWRRCHVPRLSCEGGGRREGSVEHNIILNSTTLHSLILMSTQKCRRQLLESRDVTCTPPFSNFNVFTVLTSPPPSNTLTPPPTFKFVTPPLLSHVTSCAL